MKCLEPTAFESIRGGRPSRPLVLLAIASAWLMASSCVVAQEPEDHFRYTLWAGLELSDNRLRSDTQRESEVLSIPQLDFSLHRSTDRLRARGDGVLRIEHSLRGSADLRVRARLGLMLDWSLLPQRLYWTFQNAASVAAIDPLAADGADNRQQTNVFLTGPVLTVGNPDGWSSRMEARAARASAEESGDFDHDRYTVAASLLRRSDAVRTWSLGVEHGDIRFDRNSRRADFQRQDVLVSYDHQLPQLGLNLVVGHTWIDRVAADRLSNELLRASLRWPVNDSNTLHLDYVDELSDSGRDLVMGIDARDRLLRETRRVLIGPDLHRLRNLELQWTQRGIRSEWSLTSFVREYDYLDTPEVMERDAQGLRLAAFLRLTPTMILHGDVATAQYRFEAPDRRDRDSHMTLSVERLLDPRWSVRVGLGRFQRSSDFAGADYREHVVTLFLVYAHGR